MGLSKAAKGEAVRVTIREANGAGLTGKQLQAALDYTESQVQSGLVVVRDVLALDHGTPLTWNSRDGYQFAKDASVWIKYERAFFRAEAKRIKRMLTGTIEPHKALLPDDDWINHVAQQLGGFQGALALLGHEN
ncbi:MAG: hypothetical protein ACRDJ9_32435 [Dehalococcoidia bacterium]